MITGLELPWGHHQVAYHLRGAGRCITCRTPALMSNADGQPQHKVCAEAVLEQQLGPAAAKAAAQAMYPKRGAGRDGAR